MVIGLFGALFITLYLLMRRGGYLSYSATSFLSLSVTGVGFLCSSAALVAYNTLTSFSNYIIPTIGENSYPISGVFLDGISLLLVWLTFLIAFLCSVYARNVVGFSYKTTVSLVILMTLLLVVAFTVRNLLEFYMYFEAVLMPMVGLVMLGSRGRKAHSALLFFFYTFASALFLLSGIGFVYIKTGTLDFVGLQFACLATSDQIIIFFLFFFGFAAKIPLVPVHLWLPEAHVEAPTVGSVFLASILLKLGTYGLYRTVFTLCEFKTIEIVKPAIVPILMISVLGASLTAIRQIDIKKIVAYSSIAHMSFSLLGLISTNKLGIDGFMFLMISHGLISASMFFAVGMLYDRFHTRNIMYYGGLIQFMPLFSIFYFITMFSNLSIPGTCNFIGELLVLYSILPTMGLLTLLVTLVGLFLTVIFCLLLTYRIIFYQTTGLLNLNLIDLTIHEFFILAGLSLYILLFGLNPNLIMNFFN